MADVWKIAQKISAEDMYNCSSLRIAQNEDGGVKTVNLGIMFGGDDVTKVNNLTAMCEQMSSDYERIVDDNNAYVLEIEQEMDDIQQLQAELEKEIEQKNKETEKEVDSIYKNAKDGELTKEEQSKVDNLWTSSNSEIAGLSAEVQSKVDGKSSNVTKIADNASSSADKAKTATKYANTTIEKGEPLSTMQDKRKSFWRKMFGGWDKSREREAGSKAVEAGNTLLDQVTTSNDLEKQIRKHSTKKTTQTR